MKVLVTGGAGYIGSHTAHQLCDAGHEVVVLDNLYSGHEWALPASALFINGDVGDKALLERVFNEHRFDGVLHFAAHIEVEESTREPAKYFRNNTVNALGLFEACARAKVSKLIFSSTAAVYGEPEHAFLSEEQPLSPMNPYGASKAMAERILQDVAAASSGGLRYTILRYFNVAGARLDGRIGQATPRATHLIKVAAETALGARSEMAIFGTDYPTADGTCERDYIHIEDLAQAHLSALEYLHAGGKSDIFNVGYGKPYSVRSVIEMMKKVSGRQFRVVEQGRRAGDPAALAANSMKLQRVLGWKPKYDSLEVICESAYRWEVKLQERMKGS